MIAGAQVGILGGCTPDRQAADRTPSTTHVADVVVSKGATGTCKIDDESLAAIRKKAKGILWDGIKAGYSLFPIDRNALLKKTLDTFITEDMICHAVTTHSGTSESNHVKRRKTFLSMKELKPRTAKKLGVIAQRIPLKEQCPSSYDWEGSPHYVDVETCQDVTDETKAGLPSVMYAVELDKSIALKAIDDTAPLYLNHVKGKSPVKCTSPYADSHDEVSYTILDTHPLYRLEYVIRSIKDIGKGWTAWMHLDECQTASGETKAASDLMFDFGMRVAVPISVDIDGVEKDYSLMISSIAAASSSPLAGILGEDGPFHRFVCGEYVKRIILDSVSNGWLKP
ncbi:MAG: hypothetical protein HN337_06420 [Deltaproteobacteria bacterium]|jgi:hypothetical protein|nr:hypothetical protein [Deltaproteobacteria bacterium]